MQATPTTLSPDVRMAWLLCGAVLLTLTLVKPLGGIHIIGTLGFTLAAAMQLYLPMWRCDQQNQGYDTIGLHMKAWRADVKIVLILAAIVFPPYVVGYHLYMTHARTWLYEAGLGEIGRYFPHARFLPSLPTSWGAWFKSTVWFGEIVLTHSLGVALPEETFYRGYFLPQLQKQWPATLSILGSPMGKAVLVSSALFALGHFLGEWNPLRLGPFFPALLFAWQRNKTGSVFGAITFHAACNVLGEVLFTFYR